MPYIRNNQIINVNYTSAAALLNRKFGLSNLLPEDGLFLSALGARICYSSGHIFETLLDKRLWDERFLFLERLVKA